MCRSASIFVISVKVEMPRRRMPPMPKVSSIGFTRWISGLFRSPKSICGHTPPFLSKTTIATRTTVFLLRKPLRIEPLWLAPTINSLGTKRKGWNLYLIKGKQELICILNVVRKADDRDETWLSAFLFSDLPGTIYTFRNICRLYIIHNIRYITSALHSSIHTP